MQFYLHMREFFRSGGNYEIRPHFLIEDHKCCQESHISYKIARKEAGFFGQTSAQYKHRQE